MRREPVHRRLLTSGINGGDQAADLVPGISQQTPQGVGRVLAPTPMKGHRDPRRRHDLSRPIRCTPAQDKSPPRVLDAPPSVAPLVQKITDADRPWIITAYALTFGSLLLVGGRLADTVGRKR